jgi:hypothetical protein
MESLKLVLKSPCKDHSKQSPEDRVVVHGRSRSYTFSTASPNKRSRAIDTVSSPRSLRALAAFATSPPDEVIAASMLSNMLPSDSTNVSSKLPLFLSKKIEEAQKQEKPNESVGDMDDRRSGRSHSLDLNQSQASSYLGYHSNSNAAVNATSQSQTGRALSTVRESSMEGNNADAKTSDNAQLSLEVGAGRKRSNSALEDLLEQAEVLGSPVSTGTAGTNPNVGNGSGIAAGGLFGNNSSKGNSNCNGKAISTVVPTFSDFALSGSSSTSAATKPPIALASMYNGNAHFNTGAIRQRASTMIEAPWGVAMRMEGMIGAYSPDSRKMRISRFIEKRSQRVWTKRVKYDVRKNFADSRVRVKGRFVKKEDEDEIISASTTLTSSLDLPLYGAGAGAANGRRKRSGSKGENK